MNIDEATQKTARKITEFELITHPIAITQKIN
jgi:hypothetical protein